MPKQISMVSLLQPVRRRLIMFEPLNSLVSFINFTFSHQAKNPTKLEILIQDLCIIFLKKVYIAKIISFLTTMRLPQLGQLDKKEKYSFTLVLFHLCEQEIQIIFKSNNQPTNKKQAYIGLQESIYGWSRSG